MRTALFLKPAIKQYSFYFPSLYPLHKNQISPQNLTHFLRLLSTLLYSTTDFPCDPIFSLPSNFNFASRASWNYETKVEKETNRSEHTLRTHTLSHSPSTS